MAKKTPDIAFEKELWQAHINLVAGIDEAGRGAWAGPVVAAAVILPSDDEITSTLKGVRDSKQMTPHQREYCAKIIKKTAVTWGIGYSSNIEIDQLGIVAATKLSMKRAIFNLYPLPQHLLIDALTLPEFTCPQTSIIKGDQHCLSIAAASVLAKTSRDDLMVDYDMIYPSYGFKYHKGYGTALHNNQLNQIGACPIHRYSFAPVKRISLLPFTSE